MFLTGELLLELVLELVLECIGEQLLNLLGDSSGSDAAIVIALIQLALSCAYLLVY